MPIPTDLVGTTIGPVPHEVDERWTMAYAAALGAVDGCYLDTTRPSGIVAHPLFVVCPEWEVIVRSRDASSQAGLTEAEIRTSVHAGHDVTIHRLVRPGDRLATTLETVGVTDIRPGALTTTRLRTVDQAGQAVATTTQTGINLGIPSAGPDRPDPSPPQPIDGTERRGTPRLDRIDLPANAAHTYTECARIWNPIHTDRAVALAAGLPDIILHGTANLAHGVSVVIGQHADGRPELVRRIAGRFAAMVRLPSTITVATWPANRTGPGRRTVPFEVRNQAGEPAVADGLVVLGQPD
ncbi:MAG: MaoC/PaaZ C-terminal domain-containing protein [Actinomycetota bacterium]